MDAALAIYRQVFPPAPTFTEASITRQDGRVFIVTGGNSGIGFELCKMLYMSGGTVYMAGRSQERAEAAIESILAEAATGNSEPQHNVSRIKFLFLDLGDLTGIRRSAATFAASESRLDVLFNNAGIAGGPPGSTTSQGLEGHIGTNCVAPLLFTKELLTKLRITAASSPPGATRVVWSGSLSIETFSPPGGVNTSLLNGLNEGGKGTQQPPREYGMSKAGNWLLGVEAARRWGPESSPGSNDGIISVTQNPGQIDSRAYRYRSPLLMMLLRPTMYKPKTGAYTLLYAGLSPDISLANNGAYVLPFGILQTQGTRKDINQAIADGKAKEFWGWCEEVYNRFI